MATANVLIIGLNGLGVEIGEWPPSPASIFERRIDLYILAGSLTLTIICVYAAKNVILAGLKSITLHDRAEVAIHDLGAQFYLKESDIGRNRAEACCHQLQELNSAVPVLHTSCDLTDEFLSAFQVVVATQLPQENSVRIDEFCHRSGIAFIKADIRGVFACVFCDFGPSFEVLDVDGEEPHTGIVAGITPGNTTLVTTVEDERLEFQEGELVSFSEVVGMPELNHAGPLRVLSAKAHSIEIDIDSNGFGAYERGGIATQHKQGKQLAFKTLAEAIENPGEFLLSDFSKFDRPALLHVGFQALNAFQIGAGRLPEPGNASDADSWKGNFN